jgi:hypothetical protein
MGKICYIRKGAHLAPLCYRRDKYTKHNYKPNDVILTSHLTLTRAILHDREQRTKAISKGHFTTVESSTDHNEGGLFFYYIAHMLILVFDLSHQGMFVTSIC